MERPLMSTPLQPISVPQRVDAVCPRCGKRPAVRMSITGTSATVTLNLRCEPCYRHGKVVYFDARLKAERIWT
jgi:hypothetical protein